MNTLNKSEEILRQLIAKEIQQVEFWFCDIYGFIKAFAIPIKQLTIDKEKEQFTLKGFDGSSIAGMAMITDSDVLAQVDITSACRYLPWDEYSVAFHCNLYDTNQVPYTKDIRHVLKNQVAKFNKHNFTISAKLEFYLFKQPNNTDTLEFTDHEGFFDLVSLAISKSFISHAILAAEKMGIAIEQFHHEVENSQFAVFLAPQNPVKTADDLVSLRYLLRRLANEQGLLASFYPKPIKNLEGSALKFCICVSHAENNHCAFSNKDDENQL